MNRWRAQLLAGRNNEDAIAAQLDAWAAEMQRVPREVAEGKVPS